MTIILAIMDYHRFYPYCTYDIDAQLKYILVDVVIDF